MSILSRWIGRAVVGAIEERQTVNTAHPRDPVLRDWFVGGDGVDVTAQNALGVPAVMACVNVLAETMGALPLSIWEIDGEQRKEAVNHPLYGLFHGRVNPQMTAVEWLEWTVANTALRGDAFSEIHLDGAGRIRELTPKRFEDVQIVTDKGPLFFRIVGEGKPRRVEADAMLRTPWKIQADGVSLSPIALQRNSFAISMQARKYQEKLLSNNAAPKGAIKVPTSIGDEAAEALIESWRRRHGGPENAGKMAVLDGGLEWQAIGMSNEDAQFVELMQMSVRDVARAFRVQPHKIGDLENATFSNIEHQGIEFLTDTILPWVRRIEARLEGWLLNEMERPNHAIEFNLRGLLRGDATARSQLYQTLFYAGSISRNEIRRLENLNPVDGGDDFFVQGGTVKISDAEALVNQTMEEAGND